MNAATLAGVIHFMQAGKACVLATRLSDGAEKLVEDLSAADALAAAARAASSADQSGEAKIDGETWFLNVFNPPVRLFIAGAAHIAQPLARMAALLGWRVQIADPRAAFATAERFPGVALSVEWPDAVLAADPPNASTAIVTLTHDPKVDDPALIAALRSPAFHIAALGSKKTHAARCERLAAAGFDAAQIARVKGPAGLAIGARSPAEIAVSILAQIIAARRGAGA